MKYKNVKHEFILTLNEQLYSKGNKEKSNPIPSEALSFGR